MIITGKSISRRSMLRGAGAALALPLLDSMVPAMAKAAVKAPTRLAFVYHPVGMIMDQWTPSAEGANFEYTPSMKPLEAFRENISILTNLAQVQGRALGDGPGDHAREGATWLTGVHPRRSETNLLCGPSADQIAARHLGKETQLASLQLSLEAPGLAGACDQNYSCAYTNTVSWRTPTVALPMEANPRVIFERLFGDAGNDPKARLESLEKQRSILDYVAGSIDRLQTGLGARDRGKLSEYLESIRDIERRIQKAEQQNAEMKLPEMERPAGAPEAYEEYTKLMIDLQAIAYQTDMTRVITFMVGHEHSGMTYPQIGVPDAHHPISHHQQEPEKVAKVAKINAYHVQMFARLLQKLQATPDGDGTLLDHVTMMYGAGIADSNSHSPIDIPMILAGGGAGHLKGGRHIRFKNMPLANLHLTLLDQFGVRLDRIGDSTGRVDARILSL